MKKVLVTGAAGFLGSHVSDLMLKRGYGVVGVDNMSHGSSENLKEASQNPNFEFHTLDVCDIEALRQIEGKMDIILHLAAFKIPRYENARKTLLVNSHGTFNTLQLALEQGAKYIITSTSDVYGKNPIVPFAEDHDSVLGPATVARWAYAASKMFDEHLALATSEDSDIYATILRIFGSYGPRQNLSWWGGPQSVFISAILHDEIIPIHGDGQQTRSFTFVKDTARGICAAAESDRANREIVNIGNNYEISILDLAHRIHKLCGKTGTPRIEFIPYNDIADRKYEDVRRRVPDIQKAKRLLDFEAEIALDDGLMQTIEWQALKLNSQINPEPTFV